MKKMLFTLALCIFGTLLSAQKSELGIHLGMNNYLGDLVPTSISFKNPNLAYGLFYRYHVNKKWSIKANLMFGKLNGDDADYEDRAFRNYSFEAFSTEISAIVEWNITGKNRWDNKGLFNKNSTPYLFAGLGVVIADPEVSGLPDNSPDLVEDFSTSSLILPVGLGYKFDLNERLVLGIEYSFRVSLTDYLDGISASGNPDANDWYSLLGVNVGYFLSQPK